MTNLIRQTKIELQLNSTKIGTHEFLGMLIMNVSLDLQNSKWRIQDGGQNF